MTLFCLTTALILVMYRVLKDRIKKDGSIIIEIPVVQKKNKNT